MADAINLLAMATLFYCAFALVTACSKLMAIKQ